MKLDLHIHSCVSPCGALAMSPAAIAAAAVAAGMDGIALTDHNTALNTPACAEACRRAGLAFLAGVEVCTAEELHVLCLFDSVEVALAFGAELYAQLPRVLNRPDKMGDQIYVDVDENILGEVELYLGTGCAWSLTDVCHRVQARGGLFIPSHVDRPHNSLLSQLGRIPDLPYDALEATPGYAAAGIPESVWQRYPRIMASDAHHLRDIGRRFVELDVASCDVRQVRDALAATRPGS
ncbi:MAG: PHP domain-containing protein [bacterium]